MNKALLFCLWSVTAASTFVIVFILLLTGVISTHPKANQVAQKDIEVKSTYRQMNALPASSNLMQQGVVVQDARVEIIRQFLHQYNSPLEPYADYIVQTADKYNLDFRLIPAIAMQESNVCKVIPTDSYNCWGWGIYGSTIMKFKNYQEAIDTVGKGISKDYVYGGLTTPDMIMKKYTPGSNGSWANAVQHFMENMQ